VFRPAGSEFVVNDVTALSQDAPAIAALAGGGFVIAFANMLADPSEPAYQPQEEDSFDEVRATLFGSDGQRLGGSSLVSDPNFNAVFYDGIDATGLPGGGYALSWRMQGDNVQLEEARSYTASGLPASRSLDIEEGGFSSSLGAPQIAALGENSFSIVYHNSDDPNRISIVMDGAVTVQKSFAFTASSALDAVGLGNGVTAIMWQGPLIEDAPASTLNFARIGSDGAAIGEATAVEVDLEARNTSLSTTLLVNNQIAVVVSSDSASRGSAKTASVFVIDDQGNLVSAPKQIGSVGADVHDAQISALAGGGFVVAWEDRNAATGDGHGSSIKAESFSASGMSTSGEMIVNSTAAGDQFDPAVVGLTNGGYVVTWTDNSGQGGDASGTSVKARVFANETNHAPIGAIVSHEGNEVLTGTQLDDIFFFNTNADGALGYDTIRNFGKGDRIVTTAALADPNRDSIVRADSSDKILLSGSAASDSGAMKVFNENGRATSSLRLVDEVHHQAEHYYVYAAVGDASHGPMLTF
jgi:hypothetical protein